MTSLRHKLWTIFGALLLILLAVSILTAVVLTRHSHALERVFRENYDSVIYCDKMKAAIDQLNLHALALIWAPGNRAQESATQDDANTQRARFQANLDKEFNNITLAGEREHTEHLNDLWGEYQAKLQQFDAAPAERRVQLYRSSLLPGFKEIHETAQWIADVNISNMVSVDGQVKRRLVEVRNWLLVLSFAGTLAAVLAVVAAGTSILRPLMGLIRGAQQIEHGNLDLNLPIRSRDEIGALAEAFNSMAAKLREFRQLDHDKLLRTQQTTQLAIDSLPDAVFIIGPAGTVEIANRMASSNFDIQPGSGVETLALKLKWLLPLLEAVKSNREVAKSAGYSSLIQLFEEGRERFLLPHAVPIVGIDGGAIGVCVILVDVTVLRAADEAKSDLVSTVSHELRTPLTSIRMAIDLLSDGRFGSLGPKQSLLLQAARQDGDRLNRIIENLMNINRIESGRAQFQFRELLPAEIIANAVDPMRPAFAEKGLKLLVDAAPALPGVFADAGAIGSAITNLLTNALKFTPAGGEVFVRAELENSKIVFSVADTGPGIPKQYSSRIFEKFFRVPSKDGPTGAGLGLAIASEIVQAHGGELSLRGGSGSTFELTLPRCDGNANEHPAGKPVDISSNPARPTTNSCL